MHWGFRRRQRRRREFHLYLLLCWHLVVRLVGGLLGLAALQLQFPEENMLGCRD